MGLAVTELPVEALNEAAGDHTYVLAPDAAMVVEPPRQIDVDGVVETTGGAEALRVKLADAVQLLASVTVTV